MMRALLSIVLGLSPLCTGLTAQNLTAPLLAGSWQSTYHNPAMVHFLPQRVTLGLPGVANDLRLQNLQYGDLFVEENGRRVLDFMELARVANEQNTVQDVYGIETLGLAVQAGRLGLSIYHRLRAQGEAEYGRDLVELVARGNAPFIGQTVELAPRGQVISFQEVGLGVSYALSDKIAIGGRLKYLAGTSNIQVVNGGSLRLRTGAENYALTLEQELTVNTSNALVYESLDSVSFDYNPSRLALGDLATGNTGLAFDLGVAVNLDRLRLTASVVDLGASIDWRDDITSLRFTGTDVFTGLDLLENLLRDTVSLETAVDSLLLTYEPERSSEGYTTEIGPSFYVGGEYDITDAFTTGAMLVLEDRLGKLQPAVVFMGRYAITEWLRMGVNVNYRADIRTNVGLHLYATPGRVQIFASSDKFITLLSTGNTSLAGVRLGLALALGQRAGPLGRSRSSFASLPEYR
ncbi:DUF5723 family protein [Neolewinella sp.]|uniref:DUF5723 family protein n=1 Tax=Neolewinella sp. TaxID=2993543 RepID=UPI003B5259C1